MFRSISKKVTGKKEEGESVAKWFKNVAGATGAGVNSLLEGKILSKSISFSDRSQKAAPKVGERELAAQAVAHKMMGLAPHERIAMAASLAGRNGNMDSDSTGGPAGAQRPRGEKAEELSEKYYEEGFDPVRSLLEQLPSEDLDKTYLDVQVGKKLLQLDVITERLSKQVMEHHDEMVKGMSLVMELERDLQVAHIICKNGRRFLGSAMHQVTQDLVVTANVKRKQVLLDMLPILYRMQNIIDIKTRLESTVDEGNYAKGLRLCSECLVLVEECSELQAIQDMYRSIEDWLKRTVEKVDGLLLLICRKFDPLYYSVVIDAYAVMDDAASLTEKIQSTFAQCVMSETHEVLKGFVMRGESNPSSPRDANSQSASRKSRLPYNDLCLQIQESVFRQCLHRTLETLFDLLCSYYTMMTWHHPNLTTTTSPRGGESPKHRRGTSLGGSGSRSLAISPTGSFDNLAGVPALSGSIPPGAERGTSSSSLPGECSRRSVDASEAASGSGRGSLRAENGGASSAGRSEDGEAAGPVGADSEALVSTAQGGPGGGGGGGAGGGSDVPMTVPNKMRKDTIAALRKALERGRKTVWELAARRVSALLSSDAICSSSPHHFLQSLEVSNRFILAGEAFSGAEAVGLRAKLAKQSEKYFKAFHRQNLEVLRMMLEKELWQRLPRAALRDISIAGSSVGNGAPLIMAAEAFPVGSPPSDSHAGQSTVDRPSSSSTPATPLGSRGAAGHASFVDWMEGGNPFTETRLREELGVTGRRSWGFGEGLSEVNGGGDQGGANGETQSPRERDGQTPGRRGPSYEEEEEEDEDLNADFIDEESQQPSRGTPKRRKDSGGSRGGGAQSPRGEPADNSPALTGSALSILRYMDKYSRLMQILQPIGPEVFKGLCQLFELYLYTIFKVFGNKDSFVVGRPQYETANAALLTPRLRATLLRITQGLDDMRTRPGSLGGGILPSPGSTSAGSTAGTGGTASLSSSTPTLVSQQSSVAAAVGSVLSIGSLDATPQSPTMTSSSNLFGLKERCVATESVMCLADLMRRWRPRFQAMLPQSAMASMEHFYARTVDAVPDLREHVYKTLARLILNVGTNVDRIASAKWELKDVGMEHNAYVEQLLAEFRGYVAKLGVAGVSMEIQDQLLEYGVDTVCEVLVEGYSRVKRCNNEGRALMSLDLQVLLNGLQVLLQSRTKPNMQIVENYIKAFYLPETEYLHWARTHPEYTKNQIIAMINLVASTYNWKRKTRVDLIDKIESGDL